ncbi:MAG: SGNH/GDSL hydrolase family protein [Pirellulales bacterium]
MSKRRKRSTTVQPARNNSQRADTSTERSSAASARAGASPDAGGPARRPWRALLFRCAALLVGLLVGIVVVEAGLRVFGIRPERYEKPRWLAWDGIAYRDLGIWGNGLIRQESRFRPQGVLMGEYVPGAKFKEVFDTNPRGYFDEDNGVPMEVNVLGLRGPLVSPAKPPGVFRILGLGDSFTFAVGVREPDTFLRRLETTLNAQSPASTSDAVASPDDSATVPTNAAPTNAAPSPTAPTRYEVLNAGTQGYNIRDEVLYLEGRWLALSPDLVLINFYLNDAYADNAFLNMGEALGIYEAPVGLGRFSYLADLVQHQLAVRRQRRATEAYYLESFFAEADRYLGNPSALSTDWQLSHDALAHAVELGREHGFRVALVIWPELYDLDGDYPFDSIHKLVRQTCSQLGVPVLDLLDTFRGLKAETLWVHPSDHHPNEEANRLAADAIARFLREQHLLTPPAGE